MSESTSTSNNIISQDTTNNNNNNIDNSTNHDENDFGSDNIYQMDAQEMKKRWKNCNKRTQY